MDAGDAVVFHEGLTDGFLHRPAGAIDAALVLTHGAGSNCHTPLLVAVANAFCRARFAVLRYDLPFRRQRPFGPPMPKSAQADRAGLKTAAEAMRRSVSDRVFLGGHSYGGRQASILAAEEQTACDGLLLLSYPLHPPKKPAELRTAHFPRLRGPALFVHGTADPFGTIEELGAALDAISARKELMVMEGAGHDLRRGKFDVDAVVSRFRSML